ncbi:MAG TPA: roadblock/LC7 domain-containing protein [Gemmatimonadaceae bacterium]|nr:roadblock/LC7 domain-containing protein [Gemmatimonadaceae bacterium]
MTSIQDLVRALRARDGVDAVVLLGRDGLVIDAQSTPHADPERMAALVPLVVGAAEELGTQSSRGSVATLVLEYAHGVAIVSPLGTDAVLLVLTTLPETGALLYELRRNRSRLAALV